MQIMIPNSFAPDKALFKKPVPPSGNAKTLFRDWGGDTFSRNATRFAAHADPDHDSYKDIISGRYRKDLRKYISPNDMVIPQGGKSVRLPRQVINTPRFIKGGSNSGVGSGKGDVGDSKGKIGPNGKPSTGEPDDKSGEHQREAWGPEISRSDIARMFMDDLKLPNMLPKGDKLVESLKTQWNTLHRKGTSVSLRDTLRNALRRTMSEASEDEAADPQKLLENLTIQRQDIVRISYNEKKVPHANAVIFYVRDCSGSMGEGETEMARTCNFYLSTLIQHQFGQLNAQLKNEEYRDDHFGEGVQEVFLLHDTEAKGPMSEREFYETSSGGGTNISPVYRKIADLIREKYNPKDWNIYIFHYSDGDNYYSDNDPAMAELAKLLPDINEFGHIQTQSGRNSGSGVLYKLLAETYGEKHHKVRICKLGQLEKDQLDNVMKTMLTEREETQGGKTA